MIYVVFFGLAIAVASTMSWVLGNLFLAFAVVTVLVGAAVTMVSSAVTSGATAFNDALRSSMLSFIAVGVITVFVFQVLLKQAPALILLWPVLAFIAAVAATKYALSLPLVNAGLICAANGLLIFLLLKAAPFLPLIRAFVRPSGG